LVGSQAVPTMTGDGGSQGALVLPLERENKLCAKPYAALRQSSRVWVLGPSAN